MNNEQLQDWLAEFHERISPFNRHFQQQKNVPSNGYSPASTSSANSTADAANIAEWRGQLQELSTQTNMLLNYLACNFEDTRLSAPLIAQILSLYYKFGMARCFVLQLIPSLVHLYLKALTRRWLNATRMLETLFLAIYNEEILAAGPGTPSMAKRAEEVRLPLLRHCSVAGGDLTPTMVAGPIKIQICPQSETASVSMRGSQSKLLNASGSTQKSIKSSSTVRVGPYPAVEAIITENRFAVLTRLMKTVNQLLVHMAPEVVCRSLCRSLLYICRSGFSFKESDFRQRVLREWANSEVFADFSKKSRIRVASTFLVESMNGLSFALLNGYADIALRALDALHQRAQYEMMADVLLETNALRNALSDPRTVQSVLARGGREAMVEESAVPKNNGFESGANSSSNNGSSHTLKNSSVVEH